MAWTLATGAAMTLSWFGVHTVLSSTAYDPPAAMPIEDLAPEPQASSTRRPASPSTSPTPSTPEESASPSSSPTGSDGSPSTSPTPSGSKGATPGTRVRSYSTQGGRVAFDLRAHSASLVSATPTGGWQVQVWRNDQWIRVSFTRGDQTATVFCTWHDSSPRVQIDEHEE